MDQQTVQLLGQVATIAVIAVLGALNHYKGRQKDQAHAARLDAKFTELREHNDHRFTVLERQVERVETICVGHDGENGLRGDIRRIERKVDELEERERRRLEERAARRGSSSP